MYGGGGGGGGGSFGFGMIADAVSRKIDTLVVPRDDVLKAEIRPELEYFYIRNNIFNSFVILYFIRL